MQQRAEWGSRCSVASCTDHTNSLATLSSATVLAQTPVGLRALHVEQQIASCLQKPYGWVAWVLSIPTPPCPVSSPMKCYGDHSNQSGSAFYNKNIGVLLSNEKTYMQRKTKNLTRQTVIKIQANNVQGVLFNQI